jgi:Uncharacterized conserved protein (DUF2190)
MSQMNADRPHTLLAAGAIANRFRFVVISGAYTVSVAGAGVRAHGINIDTADAAGRGIAVAGPGSGVTCKLTAGAAFSAGALLKPDASGRGIAAAGGEAYSAVALEAALAAGDIVEVQQESGVA